MSVRADRGVAVRPDVGADVGLGHLRRCLTIAAALDRHRVRSFLLLPEGAGAELARAAGFAVERLEVERGGGDDLAETIEAAERRGNGVVLVDSYAVGREYLGALTDAGQAVATMDDLCAFPFPCRLVVNGGLGAETRPYRSSSGDTEFLLGARYAPLRSEFWDGPPRRAARSAVPRVLVVFGGGDFGGLTPVALRALDRVHDRIEIVAVVGPLAENGAAVDAAAQASRHHVEVRRAPADFLDLVTSAELAVSAGGGTLVELVAAGTPAVAVEVAANQRAGIEALAASGAAVTAGRAGEAGLEGRIGELAQALLADRARSDRLVRAGRSLLDGRGAVRIATRIASLVRPQDA